MKTFFSCVAICGLVACKSGYSVFTNRQDFSARNNKSYYWLDFKTIKGTQTHPLYYNESIDRMIRQAVNEQMQAKGFSGTIDTGALKIRYDIIVDDKIAVYKNSGDPHYYNNYIYTKPIVEGDLQAGALIIEIADSRTNKLYWRGMAKNVINSPERKRPVEIINAAVTKLFKKFP
ncbi:MAG: DUF4136 domain-containing protein [Ferruginibacter sp.]